MAFPTIVFSDPGAGGSGSDTNTSGAGPGDGTTAGTALTGTGASLTSASAAISLAADSPDLSAVDTTGLHVLWVNTSSGRQSYRIVGVNNSTKVVTAAVSGNEVAPTVTESGRTWAIGGKRGTLDASRTLVSTDAAAGWTLSLATAQVLASSPLTLGATATNAGALTGSNGNGFLKLIGSGGVRTITQQGTGAVLNGSLAQWRLESLKLANSNGTKTSAHGIDFNTAVPAGGSGQVQIVGSIIGDSTNTVQVGINRSASTNPHIILLDSEIRNCVGAGVSLTIPSGSLVVEGSYIHNCGGAGLNIVSIGTLDVTDNVISANGSDGIVVAAFSVSVGFIIRRNTIHGNAGAAADGIDLGASVALWANALIHSNNITGNGTSGNCYGIKAASGADAGKAMVDYNNYGSGSIGTGGTGNLTAATLNLTAGTHALNLDPSYTNAASANFAVGNATVKAGGFPGSAAPIGAGQSGTTNYGAVGAAQPQATAGGGLLVHPGMSGGMRG